MSRYVGKLGIFALCIVLVFLMFCLSGCTSVDYDTFVREDNNYYHEKDTTSDTMSLAQILKDAKNITIEEHVITINKEYDVIVDGVLVATVTGKYINITGDVFELRDTKGELLAKEKQIKRWGVKLNRLAEVKDENDNVTGYIGEDVISDFFSISKYKFHFYDKNKNEYASTKEQLLSLFYKFKIYDNNDEEVYIVEEDFSIWGDVYNITKLKDSDVPVENAIFLTCIIDSIRDANDE